MIFLLAVAQLQAPQIDTDSSEKMRRDLINFAINMDEIAEVFNVKKKEIVQENLLFTLYQNGFALRLKNSKIFPLFKIEKTIEYSGEISLIDLFIKGCIHNAVFEGFIINEGKVYAVPDKSFLSGNWNSSREVTWNQ